MLKEDIIGDETLPREVYMDPCRKFHERLSFFSYLRSTRKVLSVPHRKPREFVGLFFVEKDGGAKQQYGWSKDPRGVSLLTGEGLLGMRLR